MNVVVIKPRENRMVRVETDLTFEKFESARAFDQDCVCIKDEEGYATYTLEVVRSDKAGYLGKMGANLTFKEKTNALTQVISIPTNSDAEFTAVVARTQTNLKVVEEQIKKTLEALAEANKTIKEV